MGLTDWLQRHPRLAREVLSCLQGFRNGVYYGGRLRFMHALVMMLLFKEISLKNLLCVVQMAKEHALFLGRFVLLFKASHKVLDWATSNQLVTNRLLAGAVAGYILNQNKTAIKYQLVLYLFSRIVTALLSVLHERVAGKMASPGLEGKLFVVLAACCWGTVMMLFDGHRQHLQGSLVASMEFLYEQSEQPLTHWSQLVPLSLPQWLLEAFD
jgi:peroxisomal membrane protein 4